MPARRNPDLLNTGKWAVGRRGSPRCFACNRTFESRPEDMREVRLIPLSPCEASAVAMKVWGCGGSKSAPEILALTFKRHTTARMANTRRTAAILRFNWSALSSTLLELCWPTEILSSTWVLRYHDRGARSTVTADKNELVARPRGRRMKRFLGARSRSHLCVVDPPSSVIRHADSLIVSCSTVRPVFASTPVDGSRSALSVSSCPDLLSYVFACRLHSVLPILVAYSHPWRPPYNVSIFGGRILSTAS